MYTTIAELIEAVERIEVQQKAIIETLSLVEHTPMPLPALHEEDVIQLKQEIEELKYIILMKCK